VSDEGEWTTVDWVKILEQQAKYYRRYRHRLYEKVDLKNKQKILDIGCGTGAITKDIALMTKGHVVGIDIDSEKLSYARKVLSGTSASLVTGDWLHLPFKDETFDMVVFCIVLMYIEDQQRAVREMARVTQKNGICLATMEPDYVSTIQYPENPVFTLLFENLKEMGADLGTGRKLRSLFGRAGMETKVGVHTWDFDIMNKSRKEQKKLFLDRFWLSDKIFRKNGWTQKQINEYKKEQLQIIEKGLRFTFLPVFYAIGKKQVSSVCR
jgi:ubiquinone/menaquinone biosynthesis C-methylase UbiE